jgi:hypothetical protein
LTFYFSKNIHNILFYNGFFKMFKSFNAYSGAINSKFKETAPKPEDNGIKLRTYRSLAMTHQ